MKVLKKVIIPILLLGMCFQVFSSATQTQKAFQSLDERGEVRFKFFIKSPAELLDLTNIVSLDKVTIHEVEAYANREEFETFLEKNYAFEVLPYNEFVTSEPDDPSFDYDFNDVTFPLPDWTKYPSYTGYKNIMAGYETSYPSNCKMHKLGTSVRGRDLLVVNVTKDITNIKAKEAKPKFLYNAGIHGNELVPIQNAMRLVEWLNENYSSDSRAKRILDSIDLWVSPMLNPDATYRGGNSGGSSVVNGSQRANYNGVDLNRNWKRLPGAGNTPTPQKETNVYRDYANSKVFVMGIGWHSGTEGISYPWSSFGREHPDKDWYEVVGEIYRKQAQKDGPSGFFDDINNGNGQGYYHLYPAQGTAKDAVVYYSRCRTNCHESSQRKNMPESSLNNYWNYHFEATIKYVMEVLHGIRGTVVDEVSKEPLPAKINLDGHDTQQDNSFIYADTMGGVSNYHRLVAAGTYNATFSCEGCDDKTVRNISVTNGKATIVDVELDCGTSAIKNKMAQNTSALISIRPLATGTAIDFSGIQGVTKAGIYNVNGKLVKALSTNSSAKSLIWDSKKVSAGCYFIHLQTAKGKLVKTFTVSK